MRNLDKIYDFSKRKSTRRNSKPTGKVFRGNKRTKTLVNLGKNESPKNPSEYILSRLSNDPKFKHI